MIGRDDPLFRVALERAMRVAALVSPYQEGAVRAPGVDVDADLSLNAILGARKRLRDGPIDVSSLPFQPLSKDTAG